MYIFIKHILRNIQDKKFISILILISTALSGALLFVALSIADVLNTVANNEFESVSTTFLLMFVLTSFLGIFVVYSSFKYIMEMRIKTLGTFRSIGSNKKSCRRLLLFESAVYGFLSGIIAIILGIIMLAVLGNRLSNGQARLIISSFNLVIAFVFCIALSVLCAYFPIKSSEKHSVKEIILQTYQIREKNKLPALILGLTLIGLGLLFTNLPTLKYNEAFIVTGFLLLLAGFVICVSALIHYIYILLKLLFRQNIAFMGLKNNKANINIAVLLSIAVAVIFLIDSVNALLIKATDESFNNYNYSIQVMGAELDNTNLTQIRADVGEENAIGLYYEKEVEVKNHIPIMNVYGLDVSDIEFFKFTPQPLNLNNEEIIISKDYMLRQGLKIGETLTINDSELMISGTINEMFPSGNIGLIAKKSFETLFDVSNYRYIAVKSNDVNKTVLTLQGLGFEVTTIAQMQKKAKQVNADLLTVLDYIVIISTIAGIFGVLNNLLIAFVSQKKERALMRSLGMSKNKSATTIIVQAIITGLVGGALGLIGGMLLSSTIPTLLMTFEFPAQVAPLAPITAILCIACSMLICVFASLLALINNSKTNIIQTLREEII